MNFIKSFWRRGWWSKLTLVFLGLFILFTIIGFSSPKVQQSSQEGYKAGKDIVSNSTSIQSPTKAPSKVPKIVGVCPTKTANIYSVIKCNILLDKYGKQYNDIYAVIDPSIKFQEDEVRRIAYSIKAQECQKDCYLNIWDDVDSANLAFTYDLLSEADQKTWKQNHASFFTTGGGLDMHFIATFDTDGNKFDYMVEPPTPSPRKFVYELEKPYFDGNEKWQTIIVPNDSTLEELTNLAKDIHKNNPEIYYNIFDNKDEFIAYQKWAISKNDPDVYFPEKWEKEHSVGFINKMLTTRGMIWQLYPTPSDFWGNSVPQGVDLE